MGEILYLKIEQQVLVKKQCVKLQDIASVHCTNKGIEQKLKDSIFLQIEDIQEKKYVYSILYVISWIHQQYPTLQIENMGETDFILSYMPKQNKKMWIQYGKIALVSGILAVGSAFSIMTFNEDVSVKAVFSQMEEWVLGQGVKGFGVLEMGYAFGLPIGICVFFNHFSKRAARQDPTPLQVEMRIYENEVNTAMIENASRKGKQIDVG
ncbi:MAG: stage V sporulation protein AA [Lachnospiraceae bacterium]|nr:stage V sporulation protein AA [Lachnospiraceae bacterium]